MMETASSMTSTASATAQVIDKSRNHFKIGAIDFTAGSLGGIALVYVSQPLDTVKVKMQTFPQLYNGMSNCLMETLRKDGVIRGWYAGTLPAIIANVSENSVLFAGYGACQSLLAKFQGKSKTAELSPLSNATAGVMASFFSTFTLCPTELVKCRLQSLREKLKPNATETTHVKHITPFQMTRQILRTEGVLGLYRGFTSTMAREMPGYFFFFGAYEGTRELLRKPNQSKDDIGLLRTMVAGSAGGLVLWTVIFPADVIKSRVQINNIQANMFSVGLNIARTEGPLALYNGLKPTLVRTIPATAVLFVVYEYTKKALTNIFIN